MRVKTQGLLPLQAYFESQSTVATRTRRILVRITPETRIIIPYETLRFNFGIKDGFVMMSKTALK